MYQGQNMEEQAGAKLEPRCANIRSAQVSYAKKLGMEK
jgi:hypothetical protein